MQLIRHPLTARTGLWLLIYFLCSGPLLALETDRQKPLEVNADSTDGTLGDGITTLRGSVEIRQGTLHITADEAEVIKADGRVQKVTFKGKPAALQQEIEEQGLVRAVAQLIEYQVASGLVTLSGSADVKHPQYQISGELLTYDLNIQHFKGSGGDNGNGRIHIRLDPEVLDDPNLNKSQKKKDKNAPQDQPDVDVKPDTTGQADDPDESPTDGEDQAELIQADDNKDKN
jgi:lipopolysaccharide export system protein LptA